MCEMCVYICLYVNRMATYDFLYLGINCGGRLLVVGDYLVKVTTRVLSIKG